jgi:transposase
LPIIRSAAVVLKTEGQSTAITAEKLGISDRSVRRWESHFKKHGNVEDQPRSGRPKVTNENTDIDIAVTARVEKTISARGVKRKLDLDISRQTVDRRLRDAGLPGRLARHKRAFTQEDKDRRLAFANQHAHWSEEQWMSVIYADETLSLGEGHYGQIWIRRPVGEADNPDYCVDKKPHPVKVNLWGCFCGRGLGYMYIFNENMDAKKLRAILDTHLLPSVRLYFQEDPPEPWSLMHDNAPQHKSQAVRKWLHDHGVTVLVMPPYSPDLNPIENLWYELARRVEKWNALTMEALQDAIAEEWKKTDVLFLSKLAKSMPARCKAVIEMQGDHTLY